MTKKEFLKLIGGKKIDIYLQPIISLPGEEVVGYEALARGPAGSRVFHAEKLFKTAEQYGMTQRLEMLCAEKAVEAAKFIPEKYWIAINVGPELFSYARFYRFAKKLNKSGLLDRIVFELTEQAPFIAINLLPMAKKLKRMGLRLSLDDMGCGFINMDTVRILRPAIVKLCIRITDTIKMNKAAKKMIKGLVKDVRSYGGALLAEGVERKAQVEVLKSCSVPLVQGSYYAKPSPAKTFEK